MHGYIHIQMYTNTIYVACTFIPYLMWELRMCKKRKLRFVLPNIFS